MKRRSAKAGASVALLALMLVPLRAASAADTARPPQGLGLGTYLGFGPGGFGFYALSWKKWLKSDQAVDGAMGAFFNEFYSHVDYKWRWDKLRCCGKSVPLDLGAGVSTFVGDRTWVGLRGTLGASRLFPGRRPWEVFIEFTPTFFVTPERIVEAALGFGGRVYF